MKVNSTYWRSVVTGWYEEPLVIKQDSELIDFIKTHQFQNIIGVGDLEYFTQFFPINVSSDPADFCIYIMNQTFSFEQVIKDINNVLENKLRTGAFLYLAVNKFLAEPKNHNITSCGNYDLDIKNYFESNINAKLINFFYDDNDSGASFNWAHPVTRFYFTK